MTSLIGKTMERVIAEQMLQYLTENSLLSKSQHVALKGKHLSTNLTEYFNMIEKSLENNDQVAVVFTDYSKCFDTISHKLLIYVLKLRYNIGGKLLMWIQDWLTADIRE